MLGRLKHNPEELQGFGWLCDTQISPFLSSNAKCNTPADFVLASADRERAGGPVLIGPALNPDCCAYKIFAHATAIRIRSSILTRTLMQGRWSNATRQSSELPLARGRQGRRLERSHLSDVQHVLAEGPTTGRGRRSRYNHSANFSGIESFSSDCLREIRARSTSKAAPVKVSRTPTIRNHPRASRFDDRCPRSAKDEIAGREVLGFAAARFMGI
jgi:hypothetical protein